MNEYYKHSKVKEFNAGDIVRVTRKAESREHGWDNDWVDEMNIMVGQELEVLYDDGIVGVCLDVGEWDYDFPHFVLELVKNT